MFLTQNPSDLPRLRYLIQAWGRDIKALEQAAMTETPPRPNTGGA
jgi:hypothetical protein